MKRAGRILAFLLYLLGLVGVFSTGCGGRGPTAPDEAPTWEGPAFIVRPADEGRQRLAVEWWDRQAACVGVSREVASRVPVDVVQEAFDCGGVLAAGCMHFARITVVERWFEPALSHEFIHYALWRKGAKDIGHSNPAFPACDVLNVGAAFSCGGVK